MIGSLTNESTQVELQFRSCTADTDLAPLHFSSTESFLDPAADEQEARCLSGPQLPPAKVGPKLDSEVARD